MKPLTEDELIAFINASGENGNIDAKAPMEWDSDTKSAKLTKQIIGFANSQDGGVLVIGKSELSPGKFDLTGVSPEQAETFDQTKVAQWVNARCAPSVELQVCLQTLDGKEFVLIVVGEFADIPIVCTRQHPPSGNNNLILRCGAVYIRNNNAQTKIIESAEDMRRLVGLATKKRAQDMIAHFDAMLKGRPLVREYSDEERIEQEADKVQSDLVSGLEATWDVGAWYMKFHPTHFVEHRWSDAEMLEKLVQEHSVSIRSQFPGNKKGTHPREWGIANDTYGEAWGLTRSGLFVYCRPFQENRSAYESKWSNINDDQPNARLEPGTWVAYQWQINTVLDFFVFISRFAEAFEPGTDLKYELVAKPMNGKSLASVNPMVSVNFDEFTPPCRANEFSHAAISSVEGLVANWKDSAAEVLKSFFGLFPETRIKKKCCSLGLKNTSDSASEPTNVALEMSRVIERLLVRAFA